MLKGKYLKAEEVNVNSTFGDNGWRGLIQPDSGDLP